MAATTKGATGAAGGAGADAVLLEAAATALPAAVAGVLVRGVKKVAAACFFCTAAAVLATSDFFAFFAFDLAPSFAPRVRPIAQSKRRAKDLAKDSTRVEQEPPFLVRATLHKIRQAHGRGVARHGHGQFQGGGGGPVSA